MNAEYSCKFGVVDLEVLYWKSPQFECMYGGCTGANTILWECLPNAVYSSPGAGLAGSHSLCK